MTGYYRNSKKTTRNLLELINKFGKVAGYKINIQKSVAFLYTKNEISEREIKEAISFTIASKIIKYLGINIPNEVKVRNNLHTNDIKTSNCEIRRRQM